MGLIVVTHQPNFNIFLQETFACDHILAFITLQTFSFDKSKTLQNLYCQKTITMWSIPTVARQMPLQATIWNESFVTDVPVCFFPTMVLFIKLWILAWRKYLSHLKMHIREKQNKCNWCDNININIEDTFENA